MENGAGYGWEQMTYWLKNNSDFQKLVVKLNINRCYNVLVQIVPLSTSEEERGKEAREKIKSEKPNDIKINSSINDQTEKMDQEKSKKWT